MKRSTEAILIFKITNNETVFHKKSGKEFREASEEWKRVVKFFKFKKDVSKVDNISNAEARELKKLDYIFGPLRFDGIDRTSGPTAWNPSKYQLCLKTSSMAEVFYNQGHNNSSFLANKTLW